MTGVKTKFDKDCVRHFWEEQQRYDFFAGPPETYRIEMFDQWRMENLDTKHRHK